MVKGCNKIVKSSQAFQVEQTRTDPYLMCAESDGNPQQDLEALVALHERMDILSEVRFNHSCDSTDILRIFCHADF